MVTHLFNKDKLLSIDKIIRKFKDVDFAISFNSEGKDFHSFSINSDRTIKNSFIYGGTYFWNKKSKEFVETSDFVVYSGMGYDLTKREIFSLTRKNKIENILNDDQ